YADETGQAILGEVASSELVGEQATIVMEHSQKLKPEAAYGNFKMIKSLHHGETCISIFQFEEGRN
ncbi:MAG: hypothetical protein WC749_06385, partial [Dehalococcoidia bacterium]